MATSTFPKIWDRPEPCIVLDDVDAAAGHLSKLGRAVLAEPTALARIGVTRACAEEGWAVIPHLAFSRWVATVAQACDSWIVLDPLLELPATMRAVVRLRLTRVLDGQRFFLESAAPLDDLKRLRGARIGIVDDGVLSGMTLGWLANHLRRLGGFPSQFITCIATRIGAQRVRIGNPSARWDQFHSTDAIPLHMRDGCCFLPYSGRKTRDQRAISTANGRVVPCLEASRFKGGPWEYLRQRPVYAAAAAAAKTSLLHNLSAALRRRPTVADVAPLGENVWLPMKPGVVGTENTPLEDVLE